jgi:hypothetical protein
VARREVPWAVVGVAVALALAVAAVAVMALLAPRPTGSPHPAASVAAPASIVEPVSAPPGAHVLVGAGDIAECGTDHDEATARVVEGIAGTVFTAGDNAYPSGTIDQYRGCYEPTWGRFRDRTRPVPGNHEYQTSGAAGYFEYFGAAAGDPAAPWYVYDLGRWRVYALDSNCSEVGRCAPDSPQAAWLRQDLDDEPRECVLAYWHHPRFSSGRRGDHPQMQALWATLAESGADVVIAGHDHLYERFAPLDAAGLPSPSGIRSFIVGTGGKSLYEFHAIKEGSEVREHQTFGVLVLTLHGDSYAWRFAPAEDGTFTDSGSEPCR